MPNAAITAPNVATDRDEARGRLLYRTRLRDGAATRGSSKRARIAVSAASRNPRNMPIATAVL